MHILIIPSEHFVTEKAPLAGIFQAEQAVALQRAGHQVGVLSVGFITPRYLFKSYPYLDYQVLEGVTVYRKYQRFLLPFRLHTTKELLRKNVVMADDLFQRYVQQHGKPDVIHAHNFFYGGGVASHIGKKFKVPFVLTEHSSAFARGKLPKGAQAMITGICHQAKLVTCVSSKFQELLQAKLNMNFEVLHNILNRKFYSKKLKIPDSNRFTFLNVAMADENKAQSFLLKAFSEKFKGSSAFLKIVGDGPLLDVLKDKAKQLGIAEQVEFTGRLTREEVRKTMESGSCFVLPSKYETFGVVLIEALASGLPLVATKCGGPEDIVNDGNGILVEVADASALGDAMEYVYNHPSKFDGKALRQEAIDRFGEEAFVKKLLSLYEVALDD